MEICELKIDRPIWRASSAPAENPAMPPIERKQQRFRKEDGSDRKIARAERLHQTDFNAPLKDRRGHGGGNSERGGEKRGQRNQQHQSLDA